MSLSKVIRVSYISCVTNAVPVSFEACGFNVFGSRLFATITVSCVSGFAEASGFDSSLGAHASKRVAIIISVKLRLRIFFINSHSSNFH